jgi:hypothetical protein
MVLAGAWLGVKVGVGVCAAMAAAVWLKLHERECSAGPTSRFFAIFFPKSLDYIVHMPLESRRGGDSIVFDFPDFSIFPTILLLTTIGIPVVV